MMMQIPDGLTVIRKTMVGDASMIPRGMEANFLSEVIASQSRALISEIASKCAKIERDGCTAKISLDAYVLSEQEVAQLIADAWAHGALSNADVMARENLGWHEP